MNDLEMTFPKKTTTIVPIIRGGVGNQLFIFAAALALKKCIDGVIKIDKYSGFGKFDRYNRDYALPKYLGIESSKINTHVKYSFIRQFYKIAGKKLSCVPMVFQDAQIDDILVNSVDLPQLNSKIILNGYFQNWRIPNLVACELTAMFDAEKLSRARSLFLQLVNQTGTSIAIHLRRFEESSDELIFIQSYCEKIKCKCTKLGIEFVYIFSENQEVANVAASVFGDKSTNLSSVVRSDIDEFFLISQFQNIAISESTFGWWAAWLGQQIGNTNSVFASGRTKLVGSSSWKPVEIVPTYWELV